MITDAPPAAPSGPACVPPACNPASSGTTAATDSTDGVRTRPGKTPFPRASDMTVLLGPAEWPAGDGRRLCVVDPTHYDRRDANGKQNPSRHAGQPAPVVAKTRPCPSKSRPPAVDVPLGTR